MNTIIVRGINWNIEPEDTNLDINNFETENAYLEAAENDIALLKSTLPRNINIEWDGFPEDDEVVEFLSDYYGWLIESIDIIINLDGADETIKY